MNRLNRCLNCSIAMTHIRRYVLRDVGEPVLNTLRRWIEPTPILPESAVCHQCFTLLEIASAVDNQDLRQPDFGHREVCYGCGTSILRTRTHRVPDMCLERNIIVNWVFPHLVPLLMKVCRACWLAAHRTVQINLQHDQNRQLGDVEPQVEDPLPQPVIPLPPPMPAQAAPVPRQEVMKVISHSYKRAPSSTRHCIFPNCEHEERLLIPARIKEMLLKKYRYFIPPSARICHQHLIANDNWDRLNLHLNDFTSREVDTMLAMLEKCSINTVDFDNIEDMAPHLCHYWIGINAAQFRELLNYIPDFLEGRNEQIAVCIYLVKLRTGDSNERLASLFNMSRFKLEKLMKAAMIALTNNFVPMHLGINHMSIEEVAQRNRIIPEGLFGNPDQPPEIKPAIVQCDATYVFVQNSSNYLYQKNTYSLHKHDNLVKPFMVVACDGHILDCLGPYKATKNDASIMADEFRNPESPLRRYFRRGDVFILDRGFRDVVDSLRYYGYEAYMPESLLLGEHQLTTLQANKSRCVTMCRWVIEAVNGRLKRDYKIFRHRFNNRASTHLMADFRVACALINKFHPVIQDNPEAAEYLARAQERVNLPNHLADIVNRENMNRRRAAFMSIDANHPQLNLFPRLTIEDLKRLALGTYQLKQARSYYGEHVRPNGTYVIEVNTDIDEDLPLILGVDNTLLRGRVKSRHIGGRIYYTYILYRTQGQNNLEDIKAYCCSCLVGNRTVGCCAHTMTLVWYLSWARYDDNLNAPAPFLDNIFQEYVYENEE